MVQFLTRAGVRNKVQKNGKSAFCRIKKKVVSIENSSGLKTSNIFVANRMFVAFGSWRREKKLRNCF